MAGNKKSLNALIIIELLFLAAIAASFLTFSFDGGLNIFTRDTFLTATTLSVILLLKLIITVFLSGISAGHMEKDRRLIEELNNARSVLEAERDATAKELKTFKINHERISKNVAELFTLQVVSDTINSTLELDRLLYTVNDIIIGIMGVNTCTICIFDENSDGIRYLVSNEKREDLLEKLRERAMVYLQDKENHGGKIFSEKAEGFDPVSRIAFTPVVKNKHLLGVIITGHSEENMFDGEDTRFMEIICNQISMAIENAKLYEKVNIMANTDFLTGLYNRTYFYNCFQSITSNLPENVTLTVAMLDIDNFKNINDKYGHDIGDLVLVGLAKVVKNVIRKEDIFARFGGEEFVLVMQNISKEKGSERLDQIRKKVEETVMYGHGDKNVSITVSIGVAYFLPNLDNFESIIKKADLALYKAKKNGKNRIEEYSGELES